MKEEKLSERTKFSLMNMDESDKKNLAPAYIESLIEVTTENLKKSTAVIEKQILSRINFKVNQRN